MGSSNGKSAIDLNADRLSGKVGRISFSGRYYRSPRRIEDDYETTGKVLGSGYNGVVKMAASRSSPGEKFAVKTLHLSRVPADKRKQLKDEVEIFLCMDHPHVARLDAVYETEEYLHLVMECLEGGELFDRVMEVKRFSESDAADAAWQMLLAINYLHSHGVCHRDLKLENFLYVKKGSNHLKLIDFGFSQIIDPNIKMHAACGTLSYVAPEVLKHGQGQGYTTQCDLWSLGVIVFILLAGYMPFSGPDAVQRRNILNGKYNIKPEKWKNVSLEGKQFVEALLHLDPGQRLSATTALGHPWITQRDKRGDKVEVDESIVTALRSFGKASKFRRCCLSMMAWSLSNDERAKVREYFVAMDTSQQGTITFKELRQVMVEKFAMTDAETREVFEAMDTNNDEEIHYSDFLAAMLSSRLALHDNLLLTAFKKFDTDGSADLVLHIVPPRASNFEVLAAGQKTHWAFHGSAFENVWSIMNTGLVNAAQVSPELAKTGSIFGKGIYLSVEPSYAANFAKTSAPLPEGLGRWRCLFLCEVAPGPMVTIGGASSGSGSNRQGVASRDAHDVPDGVIVVEDSDAVAVRCALMYRRGGDTGGICGATAQFALAALIVIGAIAARTYFEGRGRVYRF